MEEHLVVYLQNLNQNLRVRHQTALVKPATRNPLFTQVSYKLLSEYKYLFVKFFAFITFLLVLYIRLIL